MALKKRELREMVDLWADRLGIGHIQIDVEVTTLDEATTSARVHNSPDYDRAQIQVAPWLLNGKQPEECLWKVDPEQVIVHELLHVALHPMSAVRRLLEDTNSLHRDVSSMVEEAWKQREEEVVDRLAVALVKAWAA